MITKYHNSDHGDLNPFLPIVPTFAVRETLVSRTENVGTVGKNGLILTQLPMVHFQPMMLLSIQVWLLMTVSFMMVDRLMQTPSSITTPGPMLTLGPIRHSAPILAVGSINTLPTIPAGEQMGKHLIKLSNKFKVLKTY